jgi:hypothetical protein
VLATIATAALFARRLLPERASTTLPTDFSNYLPRIIEHWGLDRRLFRLTVGERSEAVSVRARDLITGRSSAQPSTGDALTLVATQTRGGRIADGHHRLCPETWSSSRVTTAS